MAPSLPWPMATVFALAQMLVWPRFCPLGKHENHLLVAWVQLINEYIKNLLTLAPWITNQFSDSTSKWQGLVVPSYRSPDSGSCHHSQQTAESWCWQGSGWPVIFQSFCHFIIYLAPNYHYCFIVLSGILDRDIFFKNGQRWRWY